MRCALWIGLLVWPALVIAAPNDERIPPAAPQRIDFARDIAPLLEARCFGCHRGTAPSSGHRLDDRDELLGLNDGEPLVIPGRGEESLLLQLAAGVIDDRRMPPEGEGTPLTPKELSLLRAWIDQGAAWDATLLPPPAVTTTHWAFQPPRRPAVPRVAEANWSRNPIDSFIAARREALGRTPAGDAEPRTLARRLHFTLTGLPPTWDEVVEFQADYARDPIVATERRAARLLASTAYGERWARHWLDLARWAESEGYESNHPRPFAWRYRDYVVDAFRNDKPYDRFLREQIAGDELTPYRDEHLIATGFLAAARLSSNEEDKRLQVNDVLVDALNTLGSVVLGLTLGCAQCHNHKLEPITQRDYYQLQGFLLGGRPNNLALVDAPEWAEYERLKPPEYDAWIAERDHILAASRTRLVAGRLAKLAADARAAFEKQPEERTPAEQRLAQQAEAQLQFTPNGIEKGISPEDRPRYDALKKQIEGAEKTIPPRPQTWGFYAPASASRTLDVLPMKGFYPPPFEPDQLRHERPLLLVRGDVHQPGPTLDATWPAVLDRRPRDASRPPSRSQLADWLTTPEHPLTARVWVNRLWHYHFGRGLVATTSDFGVAGAPPSHPKLLDWLARELIDSGWSTRHVQRLIVTSRTYAQAARGTGPANDDESPAAWNAWQPRRLEAEAIRDTMLHVGGELDLRPGGASEPLNAVETSLRRSLYLTLQREQMPRMLSLFDGTQANESCAAREVSTVALQPLYLLNSPFMQARAANLAQRVADEAGDDPTRRIERLFQRVVQRAPDEVEQRGARSFLGNRVGDESRWRALSLILLNLNELVYLD